MNGPVPAMSDQLQLGAHSPLLQPEQVSQLRRWAQPKMQGEPARTRHRLLRQGTGRKRGVAAGGHRQEQAASAKGSVSGTFDPLPDMALLRAYFAQRREPGGAPLPTQTPQLFECHSPLKIAGALATRRSPGLLRVDPDRLVSSPRSNSAGSSARIRKNGPHYRSP